ncbi:MAG: hypothetical protein MUF72_08135 [Elainella sp. Prado103]|jgi:hypothetical protein|nr:hypothetical protein [Elainella sp. Prado103]
MESSSRASSSVERTSYKLANLKLANFVGTVIALLTLTVPLFAIAHFSSVESPELRTAPPLIPDVKK